MTAQMIKGIYNRAYRVSLNLLARSIRWLMRANRAEGIFCVSVDAAFYEWQGMRFIYHFDQFGTGGNLNSGGNTEAATRSKLEAFLKPSSVFYDVGAHEGLYSISLKKRFPNLSIHAFEPQPQALNINLALNKLNVTVHSVAVGGRIGMASMTTDERSSKSHLNAWYSNRNVYDQFFGKNNTAAASNGYKVGYRRF